MMENTKKKRKGQSAIEYLILATTITIVVLVGFDEKKGFLVRARNFSEGLFNESLRGIMGTSSNTVVRTTRTNYP